MDIKEAKAAKAELEKAIVTLLEEFAERTGARVVGLEIDSACCLDESPRYFVDAEVQL